MRQIQVQRNVGHHLCFLKNGRQLTQSKSLFDIRTIDMVVGEEVENDPNDVPNVSQPSPPNAPEMPIEKTETIPEGALPAEAAKIKNIPFGVKGRKRRASMPCAMPSDAKSETIDSLPKSNLKKISIGGAVRRKSVHFDEPVAMIFETNDYEKTESDGEPSVEIGKEISNENVLVAAAIESEVYEPKTSVMVENNGFENQVPSIPSCSAQSDSNGYELDRDLSVSKENFIAPSEKSIQHSEVSDASSLEAEKEHGSTHNE